MKKDEQGRIINLVKHRDLIMKGHSVCVTCCKDMPICWDTVCCVCGDTSCYGCSYSDDKYWYCKKHNPNYLTSASLLSAYKGGDR